MTETRRILDGAGLAADLNRIASEILAQGGESWPTDTDNREQAVEIIFTSGPVVDDNIVITALQRHLAFLYQNRGDCECTGTQVEDAAGASGAKQL